MHALALWPLLLVAQLASEPFAAPAPLPAACVACQANVEQVRSAYSTDDWTALANGSVLTSRSEQAATDGAVESDVESSAIIPHPPAQVWSVLVDSASRVNFIPGLKEVRVVRTEGNRAWLAERMRVLWVNIRYQVIGTADAERGMMSWVLDKTAPHDIADSQGTWQIVPLSNGQQTLVRYRARFDSGQPVPAFIANFLIKRSLPRIISGLRAEVQRRFQP